MKQILIALLVLAALACVQKPVPVSELPIDPAARPAIDVQYVAIPTMIVYARPAADASPVGSYGLTEAVSILEKKGEWSMIRTYSGTGWVKSADLMTGAEMAKQKDAATPRFYVAPTNVAFQGRGEIILQAKVNTDGEVVEVTTTKNTTGSAAIASMNATALKDAKFYPLVDKLTRKTFIYEHHVYY